tara:strand:+ start:5996 stop:11677 length:5682 start_codon:yes stop_codon:yes gene_type:complete
MVNECEPPSNLNDEGSTIYCELEPNIKTWYDNNIHYDRIKKGIIPECKTTESNNNPQNCHAYKNEDIVFLDLNFSDIPNGLNGGTAKHQYVQMARNSIDGYENRIFYSKIPPSDTWTTNGCAYEPEITNYTNEPEDNSESEPCLNNSETADSVSDRYCSFKSSFISQGNQPIYGFGNLNSSERTSCGKLLKSGDAAYIDNITKSGITNSEDKILQLKYNNKEGIVFAKNNELTKCNIHIPGAEPSPTNDNSINQSNTENCSGDEIERRNNAAMKKARGIGSPPGLYCESNELLKDNKANICPPTDDGIIDWFEDKDNTNDLGMSHSQRNIFLNMQGDKISPVQRREFRQSVEGQGQAKKNAGRCAAVVAGDLAGQVALSSIGGAFGKLGELVNMGKSAKTVATVGEIGYGVGDAWNSGPTFDCMMDGYMRSNESMCGNGFPYCKDGTTPGGLIDSSKCPNSKCDPNLCYPNNPPTNTGEELERWETGDGLEPVECRSCSPIFGSRSHMTYSSAKPSPHANLPGHGSPSYEALLCDNLDSTLSIRAPPKFICNIPGDSIKNATPAIKSKFNYDEQTNLIRRVLSSDEQCKSLGKLEKPFGEPGNGIVYTGVGSANHKTMNCEQPTFCDTIEKLRDWIEESVMILWEIFQVCLLIIDFIPGVGQVAEGAEAIGVLLVEAVKEFIKEAGVIAFMRILKILLLDSFTAFAKRLVFTLGGELTLETLIDIVFEGLCMMKYSKVIDIIENKQFISEETLEGWANDFISWTNNIKDNHPLIFYFAFNPSEDEKTYIKRNNPKYETNFDAMDYLLAMITGPITAVENALEAAYALLKPNDKKKRREISEKNRRDGLLPTIPGRGNSDSTPKQRINEITMDFKKIQYGLVMAIMVGIVPGTGATKFAALAIEEVIESPEKLDDPDYKGEDYPKIGDYIKYRSYPDDPIKELGKIGNETSFGDVCPELCRECPYTTELSEPEALQSKIVDYKDTFLSKDWLIGTGITTAIADFNNVKSGASFGLLDSKNPNIEESLPIYKNPNICVSDDFRLAGPELTTGATQWNTGMNYSNYCCPNPAGSEPCPNFKETKYYLDGSDRETEPNYNSERISTHSCYNKGYKGFATRSTSISGIECGRKDGRKPYQTYTYDINSRELDKDNPITTPDPVDGKYTYIDAIRDNESSDYRIDSSIDTQFNIANSDDTNPGNYYGTRFTLNIEQPYNKNYQDFATGFDYYQNELEIQSNAKQYYGLCKNNSTKKIDFDNNNEKACNQLGNGYSWEPAKANFTDVDDYNINAFLSSYDSMMCNNTSCSDILSFDDCVCKIQDKSRFIQYFYDNEFCPSYNNEDTSTTKFKNKPNKFYRSASNAKTNPLSKINDDKVNNLSDICCKNIPYSMNTAYIGCDASGNNPYFIDYKMSLGTENMAEAISRETNWSGSEWAKADPINKLDDKFNSRFKLDKDKYKNIDDIVLSDSLYEPENYDMGRKTYNQCYPYYVLPSKDYRNVWGSGSNASEGSWNSTSEYSNIKYPNYEAIMNDPTDTSGDFNYSHPFTPTSYNKCVFPDPQLHIETIDFYDKRFDWYTNDSEPPSNDGEPCFGNKYTVIPQEDQWNNKKLCTHYTDNKECNSMTDSKDRLRFYHWSGTEQDVIPEPENLIDDNEYINIKCPVDWEPKIEFDRQQDTTIANNLRSFDIVHWPEDRLPWQAQYEKWLEKNPSIKSFGDDIVAADNTTTGQSQEGSDHTNLKDMLRAASGYNLRQEYLYKVRCVPKKCKQGVIEDKDWIPKCLEKRQLPFYKPGYRKSKPGDPDDYVGECIYEPYPQEEAQERIEQLYDQSDPNNPTDPNNPNNPNNPATPSEPSPLLNIPDFGNSLYLLGGLALLALIYYMVFIRGRKTKVKTPEKIPDLE